MKIRDILPNTRPEWIMTLFVMAGLLMSALVVWQLYESTPNRWCALAENTSPENTTACLNVLLKLLDIKDHVLIGLLVILGLTVLSVVAVAMGVRLRGSGPGGVNVDIGADTTKIHTESGNVTIPTPPSEDS